MAKYAAVVTATGSLLPGVNALLNSLKYYGNDVDFHLLYYADSLMIPYVQSVKDSGLFPNFFSIDLRDCIIDVEAIEGVMNQTLVFYLMTLRYIYAAQLSMYDAVVVFDADEVVVNNIMQFLEIAAKTDCIIAPNNSNSNEMVDSYHPDKHRNLAGSIIYNHPFFFNPAVYCDIFSSVPRVSNELKIADISGLHEILKKKDLMKTKVFEQPGLFWIVQDKVPIQAMDIGGKRFLVTNRTDRLNSVHGRWWFAFNMERLTREPKDEWRRALNWNARNFWETFYLFNTHDDYSDHKIEWDTENWGEPSMFSKIGSGYRWKGPLPNVA